VSINNQPERPLALLREWFEWWQANGPAKLPNSLHTRTAVAIALNDFRDQAMCGHEFWTINEDGTTNCRACGVDTTSMEGMGG
jgi:hypothetical protein